MTDSTAKLRVYLLCRYATESRLYNSWIDDLPYDCVNVEECPSDWHAPKDAGIVVTHEHYRWEEANALRRINDQSHVPTLVLADGVLEYRNTWQNPTIPDASIFQPLLADKIACIGYNSARMIESWGNHGKTEVVGLPRLDDLIGKSNPKPATPDFNLLIATATTPAFDNQQRRTVVESLLAVKRFLDANPIICDRKITITWRLTDGLDSEIGIDVPTESERQLIDEIELADAVITTPSTIYLESALLDRPTAILDFSNSPPFLPGSWMISSADQLAAVCKELADPPPAKMHFQSFTLHDNLSCHTAATPRMVKLITSMIEIGQQQRTEKIPVSMPPNMLATGQPACSIESYPDLADCYPTNDVFKIREVTRLQAELSQAIARLDTLPRELADKNKQITQLQSALDESRRRVADVRARLFKLRKILGIGKENQPEKP